jgi:glyoxylase-like metal-dependent hydrolase (beta-lactamase superfamily II)/rhodanese-related sulfurtransferase
VEEIMKTINVETLQRWLEERRPMIVVDVRRNADYAESHIPGSINVDAYDALRAGDPEAMSGIEIPEAMPVVAVCAMGWTSVLAARQLEQRGVEALSLEGGMQAWSLAWNRAGVPIPGSTAEVIQIRRTGKGCLSYVAASNGEAIVIDPSLPVEAYVDLGRQRGWSIRAVLDTHVHADHLSRARALAERTGAELVLPPNERVRYAFKKLADQEVLTFGASSVIAMSTPGHTPESTTYVLDRVAAFTGDTLFLSAVGRPDLHKSAGQTRLAARDLYQSIGRIMALGPDTIILPGHAAPPVPFDGIALVATAEAVRASAAILQRGETEFVNALTATILPTPPNYLDVTRLNESGELPGDVVGLEAGANRCAAG